jgi:hypothetical protein
MIEEGTTTAIEEGTTTAIEEGTTTAIAIPSRDFQVKVGTKVRSLTAETVMVMGGKLANSMLQEVGFATAYTKAKVGSYRSAVEIMSLGAHPSQIKACTPANGVWTKPRITMLAELIIDRASPEKGWSPRALKGRIMAKLISKIDEKPETETPAQNATDAQPAKVADPLEGVVG